MSSLPPSATASRRSLWGEMGLILQSISRRAGFLFSHWLPWALSASVLPRSRSILMVLTFRLIYLFMALYLSLDRYTYYWFQASFLFFWAWQYFISLFFFLYISVLFFPTWIVWGTGCLNCYISLLDCPVTFVTLLAKQCLWQSWAIKEIELLVNIIQLTWCIWLLAINLNCTHSAAGYKLGCIIYSLLQMHFWLLFFIIIIVILLHFMA